MKFVLVMILALLLAVALALGAIEEPGYVLLSYGEWSVETTLSLLIITLILLFMVTYYTVRFFIRLFRVPKAAGEWNSRRKSRRAREGLNQGLLKFAGGDWAGAEKQLLKQINHSDTPMVNYLAAARAAEKLGAPERRDRYLLAAHESNPKEEVAVGLTKAELQISHRQFELALATLTRLRTVAPRNRHVLEMLMRLYLSLQDWNRLDELLPVLRKRKVISSAEADRLEYEVQLELLEQAAQTGELIELQNTWDRLPRRIARNEDLQLSYAGHLQSLGADDEAENIIRHAVKRNWSQPLVGFYGQLEGSDSTKQMATAEKWLRGHEEDPELLLSLGRLALRNQLWGKARGYLESSIGIAPTVEGYQLLANLLEQMGEQVEAAECFRKATMLASNGAALPSPLETKTIEPEEEDEEKPALSPPEDQEEAIKQ